MGFFHTRKYLYNYFSYFANFMNNRDNRKESSDNLEKRGNFFIDPIQ